MPPRSLRTFGAEEKTTARIAALRGDGKPQRTARSIAKEEAREDVATAGGPVTPRKAWPGFAKKVKATSAAYEKGGEGAPPVHLVRLLDGVVPGVEALLDSDPAGWGPPQHAACQKCIIIILRQDPGFLAGCNDTAEGEMGVREDGAYPEKDDESEAED